MLKGCLDVLCNCSVLTELYLAQAPKTKGIKYDGVNGQIEKPYHLSVSLNGKAFLVIADLIPEISRCVIITIIKIVRGVDKDGGDLKTNFNRD